MHGPGFDHMLLRPWLDPLKDSAELIFYDHRGTGRSRRGDMSSVGDRTWVEDADVLRQKLGLSQVVLFGHSYGGCLAQEYALAYPQHLKGLILCATAPAFDYPEAMWANARARGTPEQFEALVAAFTKPMEDDADFRAKWMKILPIYFHRHNSETAAVLTKNILFSADAINCVLSVCLPKFATVGRLSSLGVPTLVIGGLHDWITPPDQSVRLHAAIQHASLAIFESSGHFPFVEEQSLFVSVVGEWLQGL